jgi:hypothetical protein
MMTWQKVELSLCAVVGLLLMSLVGTSEFAFTDLEPAAQSRRSQNVQSDTAYHG